MRLVLLRLGRGAEALADWKQELAGRPPAHDDWFGYAELCLFLGDEAEYRRARRDLLAQFGATANPDVAERTGRACLLLPPSADELRQAVALVERAVAVGRRGHEFIYPYYRFAEGLARYRQGRFDDTITIMTGDAAQSLGPCPRLVLAMALHQKGRRDDARQTLEEAIRLPRLDGEKATTTTSGSPTSSAARPRRSSGRTGRSLDRCHDSYRQPPERP